MRVGELDELAHAVRLGNSVRIRDHDVLARGRGDALVDVRGEAERTIVLQYVRLTGKAPGTAPRAVRDDDELVDLWPQRGERSAQELGLVGARHHEHTRNLHAASTLR